jgi:hypothetical protein
VILINAAQEPSKGGNWYYKIEFVCFLRTLEQAAIISFIAETECVYCAVRAGALNVITFILISQSG